MAQHDVSSADLARSLLKDDGAILISIDDNELHHLRLIAMIFSAVKPCPYRRG